MDDASSVLTGSNPMTGEGAASAGLGGDNPAVELSQPSEEELAETTEETVYTSAISEFCQYYKINAWWPLSRYWDVSKLIWSG